MEVVATEVGAGFRHETWAYRGTAGDRILAEAYLPESAEPWAVVVAGHGLGSDRTAPYIQGASKAWARQGLVTVAPDAPHHGARAEQGSVDEGMLRDPELLERAVGDLERAAEAVRGRFSQPLGYLGFSMGVVIGVPFMARELHVEAGAFVVGGSTTVFAREHGLGEWDPAVDPSSYAPTVSPRPVQLLNADRDELFSRGAALALYDAFRPPKELVLFPGGHAHWDEPGRPYRIMLGFFRDRLGT